MGLPRRLEDFAGPWLLTRRIDDRRAGQVVTAHGTARFTADGDGGLICDETLTLMLPGQAPISGRRRYLWRTAPGVVAVHFDDGRFFHRIELGQPASEDTHDCSPDSYAGSYDFSDWPAWTSRWRVRGPRKDYFMCTGFRRAD